MNGEYDYPRKGLVFTHEFLIDRDWVEEPWTVVSMEIMYNKYIQILPIKYDKDETVYTNGDYDGYDIYIRICPFHSVTVNIPLLR